MEIEIETGTEIKIEAVLIRTGIGIIIETGIGTEETTEIEVVEVIAEIELGTGRIRKIGTERKDDTHLW